MTNAEYGASRTAAARWTGVAGLFTDHDGRIVLEEVDYRDVRLPPGGAVDVGEPPSAATKREAQEELGLRRHFSRVLAVDWIPPTAPGIDAAMGDSPARSSPSSTAAP
jgi:8-oxo-dGTP pyrophosphatase MutT (NUDIX family)